MSYDPPDAAAIRARFPEFTVALVPDSVMAMVIEEAGRFLDATWIEADFNIAYKFLVAHYLAAAGVLNPMGLTGTSGPMSSYSLGDASINFADLFTKVFNITETDLDTTAYGRRFKAIRRSNHPGTLTI